MRLIKFSAANVFRSYNFSIDFNPDLNFLVGINGSGKTTALRLIQAALTVNVRELWTISFREMEIQFEKDAKICTLTISKNKLEIEFRVIELAGVSSIRIYEKDELEQYTKTGKIDEMAEEIRFRFLREKNLISEFMASIPEPMFIGLERRLKTNDELYDEETFRFHITNGTRVAPARHRNAPGEEGIENARRLIKNEYRKYRRIADAANSSLVNVIVRSTFKYIGIDDSLRADKSKRYAEYRNIISRRREIEQVASELGGTSNAKNQIDLFFDKLESAHETSDEPDGPALLEWLLNKAQIERIDAILKELDRNKRSAAKVFAPIESFISVANSFLNDSKKSVSVDSVGELIIQREGDAVPIMSLSSGERQLLTLLAHVTFMPRINAGIIIIDEPELSLHLRWQETLVGQLTRLNSSIQFLFATHSPEIIGENKKNALRVNR